MLSTDEARRLHVYARSSKDSLKKLGRVRAVAFHPSELRAVGYVVKRPDALLMVKRADVFAALDRAQITDQGLVVADVSDSWDKKACKRLDVDYDRCVIWERMPVKTESGKDLGTVSRVFFDERTGLIDRIDVSMSASTRFLLGSSDIGRDHLVGYADGAIVVSGIDEGIEESGGAAAKAGEAWAKTRHAAGESAKKAGDAINDGAYRTGELIGSVRDKAQAASEKREEKRRQAEENGEYVGVDKAANLLGRQLGRASGMFKGFKEEFDKASKGE